MAFPQPNPPVYTAIRNAFSQRDSAKPPIYAGGWLTVRDIVQRTAYSESYVRDSLNRMICYGMIRRNISQKPYLYNLT